jgi:dipeptidyl aminopeptidase/acylaminoacyl peptidase
MNGISRKFVNLGLTTVLLVSVAIAVTSCGTGEPELIPRTVLFGNPERIRARLSPDGDRLAYVAPVDDVLNVWVRTVGENDDRPITSDTNRGIIFYSWAQDGEHLLYIQDEGGDENWRLYAVSLETGETRDLTPYEGVQVRVLDYSKRHPNTIVVSMNQQDPRLHDVYTLDLAAGELTMVARNPGNIVGWISDYDLKVRGAVAMRPDGGLDLLVRDDEDSVWELVLTWDMVDNMTSQPVTFSADGKRMIMIDSRGANAGRLIDYDLETGEFDVLAEDPTYDVSDVMVNPDTYEVEAVAFTKARDEWEILDDSLSDEFEAMAALDDGDFSVVSRTNDDDVWLVAYMKDDGPISYHSFDRETGDATFVFDHRTDLGQYTLSPMVPFTFESSDGRDIHGYITYPAGKGRRDLPMVLNVHGGPWARDTWGYSPEAQWLANRGYVCMQVNFRGSTGYGKDFLNAGDKEWGGKMHQDLVDAVEWAVAEGIADPERVAIYGASYGGYAALVGATFTPDLFACAVDMMGPSNLITFIQTVPPYWTTMLSMMYERIGNPETEEEFLRSRSPLFRIAEIEIPMLIAQGANDVRVVQAESDQIVEAMEAKGLEVEYVVFQDEGHGFMKPENRLSFYGTAEEFLAKHLGGRSEVTETASEE